MEPNTLSGRLDFLITSQSKKFCWLLDQFIFLHNEISKLCQKHQPEKNFQTRFFQVHM